MLTIASPSLIMTLTLAIGGLLFVSDEAGLLLKVLGVGGLASYAQLA